MAELVEGARLEIVYTLTKGYRGFESLSLRQNLSEKPDLSGFSAFKKAKLHRIFDKIRCSFCI